MGWRTMEGNAYRRLPDLAPFTTVAEVRAGLAALECVLVPAGDRRGVFVVAYRLITRTIATWLEQGRFEESEAVRRYVVAFADRYRRALLDDVAERAWRVPAAWRLSFHVARMGEGTVMQDLLLGINAHINHDLPFAILDAGLDASCERCHRDHNVINAALRVTTPAVRCSVIRYYRPSLGLPARLAGRYVDRAAQAAFLGVRERAWQAAGALQAARDRAHGRELSLRIERGAAALGASILGHRQGPLRCLARLHGGRPSLVAPA